MMCLCPLHHDQASKGALPEAEQRRFKAQPFNINQGRVQGLLAVKQDYCAMDAGTITVVGEGPSIKIDGETILALYLGEQHLEISVRLHDEKDNLLLQIERNEWISGDPLPWDIQADWQVLTLRERHRKISLSLNAKLVPMQVRAELWRRGKLVTLDPTGIRLSGTKIGGDIKLAHLALVGLSLDLADEKIEMNPAGDGVIISWGNARERLWKARDAWRKIKAKRIAASNAND